MKQTMITHYLVTSGLLENGTPGEIIQAKKKFWAIRRKQIRADKRKQEKSVQVFYTASEYTALSAFAKRLSISRSKCVKQSSLHALLHSDALYATKLLALRQRIMSTVPKLESDNCNDIEGLISLKESLIELQSGI